MTDVVVLSLESWNEVWRRNQHLIAGLLRTDPDLRVLFVEPPEDPLHAALSRRRPQRGRGLTQIEGVDQVGSARLWRFQPTKWLPRTVDHRVDERMCTAVLRAVRRLGFGRPLLWVNDPGGAPLLTRTGWPALYDITDDWLAARRSPRENARLRVAEGILLRDCDEVVVCSEALLAGKSGGRPKGARPLTLIPNAVDLAGYTRSSMRPADLPAGDVALYVGTVHPDRIDLAVLERSARALRDRAVGVVLVGPALLSPDTRNRLERAGVVFLGQRPHQDIPDYLRAATVLLVPHLVDEFTRSLDPIKAYEYRAARRPVVTTPVPGFDSSVDTAVMVVEPSEFAGAVVDVVEAVRREPQAQYPSLPVPDWSLRVEQMAGVLHRVAHSSGAGSMSGGPAASPGRIRVALFGEFGVGNVGNNASATEVIRRLHHDLGDRVEIELISRRADEAEDLLGLPARSMMSDRPWPGGKVGRVGRQVADALRLVHLVGRYAVLIVPGTGVLDTPVTGRPTGIMNALAVLSIAARIRRRTLIWFAVGGGPLPTRSARTVARLAAVGAVRRSFRDALTMREIPGTETDVLSRDVMSGHPPRRDAGGASLHERNRIVVGTIDLPGCSAGQLSVEATRTRYLDNMATLTARLLEDGARLTFVQVDPADAAVTAAILTRVDDRASRDRVQVCEVRTFDALEDILDTADVVVASRFHVLLAATIVCRPLVALSHATKDDELMSQVSLKEMRFDAFDFDPVDVIESIQRARRDASQIICGLAEAAETSRLMVEQDWREVSTLLQQLPTRMKRW